LELSQFPDYKDARTGLDNVRKAKAAAAANGQEAWRIDGSLGLSDFNDEDISGSVQRYNRFDSTDVQFQAGIADAVKGGWDWGFEAGITPGATFRPDLTVGAPRWHRFISQCELSI